MAKLGAVGAGREQRIACGKSEGCGSGGRTLCAGLPEEPGEDGGSGEGTSVPGDEVEALRAILLAELRRRPGDMSALMRKAESVSRIMVAERRLSPRKRVELERNLKIVLDNVEKMMKPESYNE